MKQELPEEFIRLCRSVTNKRARIVIDHIIEYGFITTEDLTLKYGYQHPPRAARDVRDLGIPLETFQFTSTDGRHIAAYRFGDLNQVRSDKLSGRSMFSKRFKATLVEKCGERNPDDYMLLSGSANRAKSWSCEHCDNWNIHRDENTCKSCYWAFPENYSHIAMEAIRRIDIIWRGLEVNIYDQLQEMADKQNKSTQDYIKELLHLLAAQERNHHGGADKEPLP